MTLSAKRLGERCGLTAEEMNILLKEEGFLSGEPGNYYPTEKGKLFVIEKGDCDCQHRSDYCMKNKFC